MSPGARRLALSHQKSASWRNFPALDLGTFQNTASGIGQKLLGQTQQRLDPRVTQAVANKAPDMVACNQTAIVEAAKMIGGVGLREAGCMHDLADRLRRWSQRLKDGKS